LFHGVEYQRVPQEIIPRLLWLGPKAVASDIRELQVLGITDIMIASATITPWFPGCFNYTIAVDDVPSADIATFFLRIALSSWKLHHNQIDASWFILIKVSHALQRWWPHTS
jgi:hypothetical protein